MPPEDPLPAGWARLAERGWLAGDAFASRGAELAAVRTVAAEHLAIGRVFDGHRNAVERVLVHRPGDVHPARRERIATGVLPAGVWGADPGPADGIPACLAPDGATVTGVKTFCSGAGWLALAIVLVRRTPDGPPILPVLLDLRSPSTVAIDEEWFSSPALAESRSHRVVFDGTPVLAILGTEGTLSQEPWFSGDALRSTAVWAGGVDTILARLAAAAGDDPAALERLGRARAIQASVDVWLAAGLAAVEAAQAGEAPAAAPVIAAMRLELTERIRELLRLSAEQLGSRALVSDAALHAARAGLDVLLLQHRLGPAAQRLGAGQGRIVR